MVSAYGSSPWLLQVAGLVHGCRFLERPVRGMFHRENVWPSLFREVTRGGSGSAGSLDSYGNDMLFGNVGNEVPTCSV